MYEKKPFWFKLAFLLLVALFAGKADGQELPYYGTGILCQGPGFAVTKLGEYVSIKQVDAERVVKAGCQILPEDLYISIRFTLNEQRLYPTRDKWFTGAAPPEFIAKTYQLLDIYAAYRSSLINGSDTTAPILSNIAESLTTGSASISWSTNEPATSQVDYGPDASYGSSTTIDTELVTNHTVVVSGLTAGTLYHYHIKSKDASNNLIIGTDRTFTTSAPSGGVSIRFVDDETLTGTVDGTNAVFTLANVPNPASSLKVYRNGLRQKVGLDYNLNSATVTFVTLAIPQHGDILTADYRY